MRTRTLIAIVDDDRSVRDSIENLVRSLGLTARAYASASDYLLRARDVEVALLITDFQMAGLTGLDLLQEIRRNGELTPVILITGLVRPGIARRAIEAGALACLNKPIDDCDLIELFGKALGPLS
ncbi:response regulator [Bosea sp. TAB14]|uniref:response regulator n=1 Tax=Bosea sp. TAB14 TaxID=3237481 RepID=UPI003F91C62A